MKQKIVELIKLALNPCIPFLVLRGIDAQAHAEGDLDILVPSQNAVLACQLLAVTARQRGWYVLFFNDIGYLAQIVLTRASSDGAVYSVKIDFFSGLEWYGVGSGKVTERFFNKFYKLADTDEDRYSSAAVVNFLQKCLTTGRLSDRDMNRVREGGATTELLLDVARTLDLPLNENQATKGRLTRYALWRLRAASSGSGNVISLMRWFHGVVVTHLKFKLGVGFRSGLLLTLSGLDGSGKSTQVDMLLKAYDQAGMTFPQIIHLLPRWIPLPHQIIRRKKTINNYTRPYAEAPVSSAFSATLRLIYYLFAFVIARPALWFSTLRGNVVIMDRCFADFASDLSRARIPHRKLYPFIFKFCAPRGCLILIDAEPEVVVERKGELALEKATELRSRYQETFFQLEGIIIDGNSSPPTVFSAVLGCIDAIYFSRLCEYTF